MTPGKIWKLMLSKKVFQIWEIAEELQKEYPFLPRKYIRDTVREFVKTQMKNGALVQVSPHPPVFAITKYAGEWRRYVLKRKCAYCGDEFIPIHPDQLHCSVICKERKNATPLPPQKEKRKWTKEEEDLLRRYIEGKERLTKKEITAIGQMLGRSYRSVWHKIRRLRNEVKNHS